MVAPVMACRRTDRGPSGRLRPCQVAAVTLVWRRVKRNLPRPSDVFTLLGGTRGGGSSGMIGLVVAPIPGGWPRDCPPADAVDVNMVVFRAVRQTPCAAADFQTAVESDRHRGGDPCHRCGISVFQQEADARNTAKLFPTMGTLIARGQLDPPHGKIKQTGKLSHHTWWPPAGLVRHMFFEIVSDV